ncbi:hypothetical protein [Gabonibacter massiliensis]|uniref:hypothetical protein n=1 Tax=Gabonibacter massiliensis TaxID=1720195 RepID=UPI00073F8183|nr:hypothetical protein [Gabonibacter massiliensis]
MKSSYSRRLGNGIFRHSLADVSTKLIIQKHDELKALRFFIVTIIGEETEEYIDASREYGYVQSRDFSGLMIFSDLEGNYFEAYQFDRGEKKRVRLAKTGEDSKVQPEDIVNSFNLMDNGSAGVYSRSGESGGGGSGGVYCALCNKLNCNGSCEVTVIYCRNCNRPADNCICCPICRDYPCRCYTPPSPPPQWPCSYCGSTVCPGNCQTGGGGGGTTPPSPQDPCPYATPGCPGGSSCSCCSTCRGVCKCTGCHATPCECIREVRSVITSTTTGEQAVVTIGMTSEEYYVPLYRIMFSGTDSTGAAVTANYDAIRFGVKFENGEAVAKGLQDEATYTVSQFIPGYCGASPSGDAWRVYGGHLLHAGPKDLERGCNMYGCIGICKNKMTELNQKLLQYSNAKTEQALANSGKFKVHVQAATKPPLVPKTN